MKFFARDGSEYVISRQAAALSHFCYQTLELQPECPEIRFDDIDGPILNRVVVYMMHRVDHPAAEIPKPLPFKPRPLDGVLDDFDKAFFPWDETTMRDEEFETPLVEMLYLMKASDFLQVKPLLDLTRVKLAAVFRAIGDDWPRAKRIFHFHPETIPRPPEDEEEPMTPEEEEAWQKAKEKFHFDDSITGRMYTDCMNKYKDMFEIKRGSPQWLDLLRQAEEQVAKEMGDPSTDG